MASISNLTSTSANAIAIGPNGSTNPMLKVNCNTGSAATGLEIVGAAAAGGMALKAISSGTNENLTLDAKGSGTVTINGTATGAITLARATTISGNAAVTGTGTVTSTSASALAVGANGATNPVLQVDANTASVATGLKVTGAAAAAGVALAVISSGTNEALTLDAKGSGTITLGGTSTGAITLGRATTISGNTGVTGTGTVTSTSASALAVGANGATNPVLKVNANTASVATGIEVIGAAAAGGVDVAAISSGTNEALTINAKGSGTITLGSASTGNVVSTRAFIGSQSITSSHATAGLGYSSGAGGTVTQATSKSTGVTLNKVSGAITLHNAALADATNVKFTVTNSAAATTDVVVVSHASAGTAGAYQVWCSAIGSGSFDVSVRNVSGGSLGEAIVLNFAIIKAVAA